MIKRRKQEAEPSQAESSRDGGRPWRGVAWRAVPCQQIGEGREGTRGTHHHIIYSIAAIAVAAAAVEPHGAHTHTHTPSLLAVVYIFFSFLLSPLLSIIDTKFIPLKVKKKKIFFIL